jgi:hypothetical protein
VTGPEHRSFGSWPRQIPLSQSAPLRHCCPILQGAHS